MNKLVLYLLLRLSVCNWNVFGRSVNTYKFGLPHIYTDKIEIHFCTQILIRDKFYLVGFEPKASVRNAHRMTLYGCTVPGSNDSVWDCDSKMDKLNNTASPCLNGSQIIYAWSREAPGLDLPPGTGFLIGGDSPVKYLVLEVYYVRRFEGNKDAHLHGVCPATTHEDGHLYCLNTGRVIRLKLNSKFDVTEVLLKYTKERMPRQAGVILLGTSGGVIPANSVAHMETACTILEDKTIHPFAFSTHTHALGTVVSGYVVRQGMRADAWSTLGKRNPQLPEMFDQTLDSSAVGHGDVLAARCIMNNTRDHTIHIGRTRLHEMCRFYLMYWVENGAPLKMKTCLSSGPPGYYWTRAIENFQNIPDEHASTL